MTETIRLFDSLFATARRQAACQQHRLAIATLRRLSNLPNLNSAESEEVHGLLGELLLKRRKYRLARRHLVTAARINRTNPRTFYLLGLTCRHDPDGNLDRAARFFARCLRLAPTHLRCLGEAGLLAITRGDREGGLDLLRRAIKLQPDNATVIARLCRGLCKAGQPEEALRQVRLAQFRFPRCATLQRLSAELRLDRLRRGQDCDASTQEQPDPVLLPFLRVVAAEGETVVRQEKAEPMRGPHFMRLHSRRSWRRAP